MDENLGVLRIDDLAGDAIATVWNFAIHGTAQGKNTTEFSADIMGDVNLEVENAVGGVSLFLNGAEGDISPKEKGRKAFRQLSPVMTQAVLDARNAIAPQDHVELANASETFDYGNAVINVRLIDQLYHSQGPGP